MIERRIRHFLYEALENYDSKLGRIVAYSLLFLISLSIGFFIIETTEWGQQYIALFRMIDMVIVSIFAVEYLLRFYIAPKKWKFLTSPLALIDLFVIFTFYISVANVTFLRSLRVLKILQLLKVFRYSPLIGEFFKAFLNYKNELKIFGSILAVILILSAGGFFYLEHQENPEIKTFPDAIWWAFVTISTVGYGDIVPVTWGGKALAAIMMFLGLGVIAIFTAIVTKMFIDHFFGKKHRKCYFCHYPRHDFDAKFCKNCGNPLDIKPEDLVTKKQEVLSSTPPSEP